MKKPYIPIHHKYRPKRFDDLVGQESIVSTLKQALLTNRIAPAYIFCGPRGTGKTSSARILAKSLNCLNSENPTVDPCGVCNLCKEIEIGSALDIIEIDAASNTGVENIRELIEKAQFAPVQARWKVYVIDECHMLSTAAFNALLKTLEEPPANTVFVLATTDPQRILQTILSRCQRFDFRRITLDSLTKHLQMIANEERIDIDQESINLISQRSEGGLRDAESLLDQLSLLQPPIRLESVWELLGEVPEVELIKIASSIAKKDSISLVKTCRMLFDQGREPISILQGTTSILRDLVIIKSLPSADDLCSLSKQHHSELKAIAEKVEIGNILSWQAYLKGAETQIRQSLQPRLWIEVLLLGVMATQSNIKQISNISNNYNIDKEKSPGNTLNKKDDLKPSSVSSKSKDIDSNAESEENLSQIWEQILSKVELPSTRMLLSQQAKLTKLTTSKAEIKIASNWIGMIQSRKSIIEKAILQAIGSHRDLSLEKQHISKQIEVNTNKITNHDIEKKDNIINKPIETNIKNDNKEISTNKNDCNKEKTENFANFFNGEIINLDKNP